MRENIEISLTEIEWDGLEMIDLASDMDSSGGCFFELGNNLVGSITCWKFIDYLRNS